MVDLLESINKSDLAKFKKDFYEVLRVSAGVDREYTRGIYSNEDLKKYKELIKQFSLKYSLKLKIDKTLDSIQLKIFFPEKKLDEFFKNAAARLPGLSHIGINTFNEFPIAQAEAVMSKVKDKLTLSYYTPESGTNNIYFELNSEVEIFYDKAILETQNPEFKICAFYALKEGIKTDIDIYNLASSFGFVEMPSLKKERDWFNKFNEHFGE